MLLTCNEFSHHAERISSKTRGGIAFDFETTGLSARHGDKAFLMGFSDENGSYSLKLGHDQVYPLLRQFFSNPHLSYAAHNAKFEMQFLRHQFGIDLAGQVYDTEVFARVEKNNHMKYGLQACAERIGRSKYAPMKGWLEKKGNKGLYHKAPDEIIIPYVENDADLSFDLMHRQMATFATWDLNSPTPIRRVIDLEMKVTKALFEMEEAGLLIDVGYCEEALKYETAKTENYAATFKQITGRSFVDSGKCLSGVFRDHGIPYSQTEKGNPSFTAEALFPHRGHPVVQCVLGYRQAKKRASTYWENFLKFQVNGEIHPNIRQTGADTFRMSITDPAAQTWPDDSEDEPQYPIRRAFRSRPGNVLVSMDYAQVELRLIADQAGEMRMIRDIREGVDFHQQIADRAGVSRRLAKNARFAKLYGAGTPKIAETLGVSIDSARRINQELNKQCPNIAQYSRNLIEEAQKRHWGHDWLGRRYHFDPGFEYLYPNYQTQGGAGEILKIAIVEITDFLKSESKGESRIILPVHDEILMDFDPCDLHLLSDVKRLMIGAYRAKRFLDLDVSTMIGQNYHDMKEVPCDRDSLQKISS